MFGNRYYYRERPRTPFRLVILAILVGVGVWWWSTNPNFHVVLPARVYRSAQPTTEQLREYHDHYHIQTIINLRGPWSGEKWYEEEHQIGDELGMNVVDINLINHQLPPLEELRRLIKILDESEDPVLLHCRSGAIERDWRPPSPDCLQVIRWSRHVRNTVFGMGIPDGHNGSHLPNLFDLYQDWLVEKKQPHTVATFRKWVDGLETLHYFSASITPIDYPQKVPAGSSWDLHVAVKNSSQVAWPGDETPMQIFCWIVDPQTEEKVKFSVDMPRKVIAPGDKIEMTVPIPPIAVPGRYILEVDVCDGNGIKFRVMGPYSWKSDLIVTPVGVAHHEPR